MHLVLRSHVAHSLFCRHSACVATSNQCSYYKDERLRNFCNHWETIVQTTRSRCIREALSGCHARSIRRNIFIFSCFPDDFEQTRLHWRMVLCTAFLVSTDASLPGMGGTTTGKNLCPRMLHRQESHVHQLTIVDLRLFYDCHRV